MIDDAKRRRAVMAAALFAVAGTAAAIVLWWYDAPDATSGNAPAEPLLSAAWSAADARTVDLEIDETGRPVWTRSDGSPIPITPLVADAERPEWSIRRSSDGVRLVGRGDVAGGSAIYRWTLLDGDPQARLSIRLDDLPLSKLRSRNIRATLRLPPGEWRTFDRRLARVEEPLDDGPMEIGPWTPFWMNWRRNDEVLTLANWNGDGSRLRRPDSGKGLAVDLFLWQHEEHPALGACEQQDDASETATLDLRASLTLALGELPPVAPWRLADNQAGAVIPVFDTPQSHPDTALHRARPEEPVDWRGRVKTLAYGHSNSDDPRYGNGGLLGHGLGGTVVAPAQWISSEAVGAFQESTSGTRLGVAFRERERLRTAGGSTAKRWPSTLPCSNIVGGDERPDVLSTDPRPYRSSLDEDSFDSPYGPVTTSVSPMRLNGMRPHLVEDALGDDRLEQVVRQRRLAVFSTPLIASRDPTIPAAREALLTPERHGEWTVSSPFAEALASVEIFRERRPLAVSSLASALVHWQRSRRVLYRWTSERTLLVRSRSDRTIDGFTLVVGGAHVPADAVDLHADDASSASDTGARVAKPNVEVLHRNGPAGGGPPRTWMSWNLRPDTTYRVGFGASGEKLSSPSPVDWNIRR